MPEEFKGSKKTAEEWLSRVETYLDMLTRSYPTDFDRVMYALYQMQTHCKSWVEKYKPKLKARQSSWTS